MSAGSTWAGSHEYAATDVVHPSSVEEVAALVTAQPRVRALGTRHSFTDLADTPGVLIALDRLGDEPSLVGSRVRVPAGMRYGDLAVWLQERGRGLANLASLPHISVAGAVATGTHGSGVGNGSLATAVAALELVDGRGATVRLERGDADFDGAVVGLGALGIVTHLELDTEPTFEVSQTVHEGLAWPALLDGLDEVLSAAYSVSVFTRWTGSEVGQVWVKSRSGDPAVAGARPAPEQRHMIPGMSVDLTTPQLGVPGPWHERLPHFRLGFLPSSGEELQTEYLLPRARGAEALAALRPLAEDIAAVLHVTELRTIAADRLWLSGAYEQDSLAIHFTWHRTPSAVADLLPRLEERLLPLGARPHWGKVFSAQAADLAPLYPRWDDFRALADRYDPDRRFRNDWLAGSLAI